MIRSAVDDVRASARRPHVIVLSILIIVVPSISGLLARGGYALDHWMSYFTIMLDLVALPFPLLVALLTQPRLLDEWSNTFALSVRTRQSPSQYVASRILASGVLAGAVFLAMTLLSFLVARLTFSDHGYDIPSLGPIETRFDMSQLWALSPGFYVVTYSLWVGMVAATVGAWCTLLTALIANKFVALAAPMLLWFGGNFVLAVIGLEELAFPPFRFHISQQPLWDDLAGWLVILATIAGMYWIVRRRDFQTTGIVRT